MSNDQSAPVIHLGGRPIGPGHPCFIVAELSANHHQSFDAAVELVRAAKAAGADAVKIQTYTAETMTLDAPQPHFRIGKGTIWEGRTLFDLYREAYTPWDWQPRLFEIAAAEGLQLFSTPFDATSVDFLEGIGVPAHKIASFELVDLPLIERVARTGKPMIMSTGMATLEEIAEAVTTARAAGCRELALLECTSAYPADPAEMNLATLPHLREAFGVPVGLSDHSLGLAAPLVAVTLGANLIEKHLTRARADGGPDATFSLEPAEFATMVSEVRAAERAIGRVHYGVSPRESASRIFRRSLFITEDLAAGAVLSASNVRCLRPANGLAPRYLPLVLGRKVRQPVARGTPLNWDLLDPA